MMGSRQAAQGNLFYGVSLADHIEQDHMIWAIHRLVHLGSISQHLAPVGRW